MAEQLWRITAAFAVALLIFAAGTLFGHSIAEPGMPEVYEDGSGTFPDGRSFCLSDHPCD